MRAPPAAAGSTLHVLARIHLLGRGRRSRERQREGAERDETAQGEGDWHKPV